MLKRLNEHAMAEVIVYEADVSLVKSCFWHPLVYISTSFVILCILCMISFLFLIIVHQHQQPHQQHQDQQQQEDNDQVDKPASR